MIDLLETRTAAFHEVDGVRTHRHRLFIDTGRKGPRVAICGVNPSLADEKKNDQTIRKDLGFASRLGWGSIDKLNKFSRIAQDVRDLRNYDYDDAVGPYNNEFLLEAFRKADIVVFAWGPLTKLPRQFRSRWRIVADLAEQADQRPMCWGTVQDGQPYHPLMIAYATPLVPWRAPQ